MADRPIIFSAPMIQALLAGRKTQTRRLLNAEPGPMPALDNVHPDNRVKHAAPYLDAYCGTPKTPLNPRGMSTDWCWWTRDDRPGQTFKVGYQPGDRLWVRESCRAEELESGLDGTRYAADEVFQPINNTFEASDAWGAMFHYRGRGKARIGNPVPSIHMPRWASRLTLLVEAVRVQRLHDISVEDARAEGMVFTDFGMCPRPGKMSIDGGRTFHPMKPEQLPGWHAGQAVNHRDCLGSPRSAFANLWNTLHGSDAWAANPWVVALTFSVQRQNIDAEAGNGE